MIKERLEKFLVCDKCGSSKNVQHFDFAAGSDSLDPVLQIDLCEACQAKIASILTRKTWPAEEHEMRQGILLDWLANIPTCPMPDDYKCPYKSGDKCMSTDSEELRDCWESALEGEFESRVNSVPDDVELLPIGKEVYVLEDIDKDTYAITKYVVKNHKVHTGICGAMYHYELHSLAEQPTIMFANHSEVGVSIFVSRTTAYKALSEKAGETEIFIRC